MNGKELLKLLRRLGKEKGLEVRVEKSHGKGSHSTLYYGDRRTILKDGRKEIGPGLLNAMLKDLGVDKGDLT